MAETTSGVADLINRLKKDGIAAGETERERILGEAQAEAEKVLKEAENKAAKIKADAEKEAEKLKGQMKAELEMAARDFVFRFQQRIKAQVVKPAVEDSVKAVLDDATFLRGTLTELCVSAVNGKSIEVTISSDKKKELEAFFTGELEKALGGGKAEVADEQGVIGFRLKKDGDSFTWDFTLDAITAELMGLVEPNLRAYFVLDDKAAD